jgi:hypothetical protein
LRGSLCTESGPSACSIYSPGWRAHGDHQEIDELLCEEMYTDTLTWMRCEEEQSFLKFELADAIFDDLLADTVACLNSLPQ